MAEPTTLQAAERLLATLGAGRAAVLRLATDHLSFSGLTAVSIAVNDDALRIGEAQRVLDRRIDVLRARLGRPPIERTDDDATPRDANTIPAAASSAPSEASQAASPSRLQRHMAMGRVRELASVPPAPRPNERRGLAAGATLAPEPERAPEPEAVVVPVVSAAAAAAAPEAPVSAAVAPEAPVSAAAAPEAPVSEASVPPAPELVLSVAPAGDDEEIGDLGEILDEELVVPAAEEAAASPLAAEVAPPPPPAPLPTRAAAPPRAVAAVSAVGSGDEEVEALTITPEALAPARRAVAPVGVRAAGPAIVDEDVTATSDGDDEDALDAVGVAAPGGGIRLGGSGAARGRRARTQEDAAPRLTDDADEAPSVTQSQTPSIRPAGDDARVAQLMDDAVAAAGRGDLQKSIQCFTDVLDLRHDRSDASIGRGRCYLELGDYSSAMSDFQRAEDLHPDRPDPHVAMGDLYFARKEYRRAIEFYDQAVELDGSHAMARCRRGISHYYRKNYRQAFQDLQRAYALDPEIPNIRKYVQMAVKKMERGD